MCPRSRSVARPSHLCHQNLPVDTAANATDVLASLVAKTTTKKKSKVTSQKETQKSQVKEKPQSHESKRDLG